MASTTIFFDGFGPYGAEHEGEIDPLFWETTGSVSLSNYRTDRNAVDTSSIDTINGADFQGYTFGSVVKLDNYVTGGTRATLKAKNFPASFSNSNTGFGLGFFTSKIATDSVARGVDTSSGSGYISDVVSLTSTTGATTVDVLKIQAIHIGTSGYTGITNPQVGLRVVQGNTTVGTFTFDVWGAPWYVDDRRNASSSYQRTVDAYDYKYGGLYMEVCVVPDADPNDGTKPYSMQIKANGMNLTNVATSGKKLYLSNNFSNNGIKFFNEMTFYGARIPSTGSNNTESPLRYDTGGYYNAATNFLYDTYIDNVYVVEGSSSSDCLLGPTTKVFNILPKSNGVGRVNNDWAGFTLAYNASNDNLEANLKDSNGDSSYVYTETSGSILAMNMVMSNGNSIPSGTNYTVGGIKITNSVRKSNIDTSFQNVWGTGTLTTNMSGIGTNFSVNNNHYEYKNQYLLNNPITATGWTFPDVINGKFGIKKTS